jgi:hypothetical protein
MVKDGEKRAGKAIKRIEMVKSKDEKEKVRIH